jgi:cytoplasmic iron level regulating protein YaaA (DUF328/UPF0246 family)
MDFSVHKVRKDATTPRFEADAGRLMSSMADFRAAEIAETERISIRLALSAYEYIQTYPMQSTVGKEAIFAFNGNVFDKLSPSTMDDDSLLFMQNHVCILSALYGVLRPFDIIKPYRLNMETKLVANPYAYWKTKVTRTIAELLKADDGILINLASAEYFKMLDLEAIPRNTRILTPVFQQEKNGMLVSNSLFIKYARGMMLRFIAKHKVADPDCLQNFDDEGYFFDPQASGKDEWLFVKRRWRPPKNI